MAAILGTRWSRNKKQDSKVAFGSTMERKMFPVHSQPTRLGIEQGLRGDPHRGPGCYDTDPSNLFLQPLNSQPRSTRGYGFGAVRSDRGDIVPKNENPWPGAHQPPVVSEDTSKPAYQPFHSAEPRFKEPPPTFNHLGPGSHEHDVARNKRIQFDESFGGPRTLRKSIITKCTLGVPDKCCQCGQEPVGDYYQNSKHKALCRPCYNQLLSTPEGTLKLKGMRKVRDCSSTHKHEFPGKTPKTIIKSEKELKKLQYKEAYMSLYYS